VTSEFATMLSPRTRLRAPAEVMVAVNGGEDCWPLGSTTVKLAAALDRTASESVLITRLSPDETKLGKRSVKMATAG